MSSEVSDRLEQTVCVVELGGISNAYYFSKKKPDSKHSQN